MGYKSKNGKMVSTGKSVLTLYHFTPPQNLPKIIKNGIYPHADEKIDDMLPGVMAIWLTANPNGNQITAENVAYWRKHGFLDFVADYETGKRKLIFGQNADGGSARITVELPEKFGRSENGGLFNYLELLTANFRDDAPKALAVIAEIPRVADWWVVASPTLGESFLGISPGAITEVQPVGDPSPEYLAAIEQITAECERAA